MNAFDRACEAVRDYMDSEDVKVNGWTVEEIVRRTLDAAGPRVKQDVPDQYGVS